jgi:hypothetical protein
MELAPELCCGASSSVAVGVVDGHEAILRS